MKGRKSKDSRDEAFQGPQAAESEQSTVFPSREKLQQEPRWHAKHGIQTKSSLIFFRASSASGTILEKKKKVAAHLFDFSETTKGIISTVSISGLGPALCLNLTSHGKEETEAKARGGRLAGGG